MPVSIVIPWVPGWKLGTQAVTMLFMGSKVTEKDLFEIIRRQSEQIDQLIAENKALQAENARLKNRIEALERRARKYAAPFSRETRAYAGVIRRAALELSGTFRWSNSAPCAG